MCANYLRQRFPFCVTVSVGPRIVILGLRRLEMHLDQIRSMVKWLIFLHVNQILGLKSVCTRQELSSFCMFVLLVPGRQG
jgi:hypothetical protein